MKKPKMTLKQYEKSSIDKKLDKQELKLVNKGKKPKLKK